MARPNKYDETTVNTSVCFPISIFSKLNYMAEKQKISKSELLTKMASTFFSNDIDLDKDVSKISKTNNEERLKSIINNYVYNRKDKILSAYEKGKGTGITTKEIIRSHINLLLDKIKYEAIDKGITTNDKQIKDYISYYIVDIIKKESDEY